MMPILAFAFINWSSARGNIRALMVDPSTPPYFLSLSTIPIISMEARMTLLSR